MSDSSSLHNPTSRSAGAVWRKSLASFASVWKTLGFNKQTNNGKVDKMARNHIAKAYAKVLERRFQVTHRPEKNTSHKQVLIGCLLWLG